MGGKVVTGVREQETRWRSAATVLAVGVFAVGTDAFVIAGVLPDIAGSLRVDIAAAGQLVTVFSLSYALLAPILAALVANWSRRTVLVVAMSAFAIGNILTALAPGYTTVLAARSVAAAGAALFTATASATAAALAGERHRGRAIGIVMFGLTASLILGTPLGTLIGDGFGWRATMWFVTGLAIVATLPILVGAIGTVPTVQISGLRHRLRPLSDRRVLGILLRTVIVFTGIYIPYTFFSQVYAPATGGAGDQLAILLLAFGIAGTAGNLLVGSLADRHDPRRVVIAGTTVLAGLFVLLPLVRELFASPSAGLVAALVMAGSTGLFSFTVTTPQQAQIITLAPETASLVTSLYQSAVYLAVSLSGAVGGIGLHLVGAGGLPWIAAVLVFAGSLLTMMSRTGRR